MRVLFICILMPFVFGVLGFGGESTKVQIKIKPCDCIISLPRGWGLIPADTLKNRFGKRFFDIGLYNLKNNSYFDGEYIQYVFMPTSKALNQFRFTQIIKDIRNSVKHFGQLSRNDELHLTNDHFSVDKTNKLFYLTGKVMSADKKRKYRQMIIPTKFGFLKIIFYEATGEIGKSLTYDELLATVTIPINYKYIEPSSKSGLTIGHIIIAFTIGLIVYFGIQYASKIRSVFIKET